MNYILENYNGTDWADGVYAGLYNGEPAVITIKDAQPYYITFADGNHNKEEGQQGIHIPHSIFMKRGILKSSVQIFTKTNG